MFDFDATFGPQRKEKLFKEKLTDNSPCQNCEEYLLSINNPYFISDKCSTCKDAVIWRAKCIEKLAIYERNPFEGEWVAGITGTAVCSRCNYGTHKWLDIAVAEYNYCPHCSARMILRKEN